ncbi:uncharacterized protein LOC143232055 [Tachypleus tridentatus]|uniref:uncharacterized protein LOC143232055 n=1 Tax=Tachypleus tridentatus TaxID=6853 RepID=UPI003FD018F3
MERNNVFKKVSLSANQREAVYLKHEERLLIELIGKLKDQLNRLKVEELSLKSALRDKDIQAASTTGNIAEEESSDQEQNEENLDKVLKLDVTQTLEALARGGFYEEMEVEEDDDDDDDE